MYLEQIIYPRLFTNLMSYMSFLSYLPNVQHFIHTLEDTARYADLLLAPAEAFGLRPRPFLPFGQQKGLLCCFGPFW